MAAAQYVNCGRKSCSWDEPGERRKGGKYAPAGIPAPSAGCRRRFSPAGSGWEWTRGIRLPAGDMTLR